MIFVNYGFVIVMTLYQKFQLTGFIIKTALMIMLITHIIISIKYQ